MSNKIRKLVGSDDWMHNPVRDTRCPEGLENLITIDQILVNREKISDIDSNNKYVIRNVFAQKMYYALEDRKCCSTLCGPRRSYRMRIFDNHDKEVIDLKRRCACECCCFPCCLQSIIVSAPRGDFYGAVKQKCSIFKLSYKIVNHRNKAVLQIKGPFTWGLAADEIEFKVLNLDGETVGKISKHASGVAKDLFTGRNFFSITFCKELDVRMKAALLGAAFLIGLMFLDE